MNKTIKTLNLAAIDTRAKAARALTKLGFAKSPITMTRGTVTYRGYNVSVCLAPANFVVLDSDRTAKAAGDALSFIPSLLNIGNTAENAHSALAGLVNRLCDTGVVHPGDEIPLFGLAVGIAYLARNRASAAA